MISDHTSKTLPLRTQAKYWLIAATIFMLCLWALGNVLMPFILGGAIAYLLDPVADKLEKFGFSRTASVANIAIISAVAVLTIMLLVAPALVSQTTGLIDSLPFLTKSLQDKIASDFPSLLEPDSPARAAINYAAATVKAKGGALLNAALASTASIVSMVMMIVIVPVVAVYMLLDWDRMISSIDALLPREHISTIRTIASDIDRTLSSFIRGMGTVCIILGVYYASALMIAGLQFGLVIGVASGLLTFIPYVGAIMGGGLAIGLALFQFWGEWHMIAIIAVIFLSGQVLEGNVLTPKLVGNSVGLHPVWLIFSLSVFGSLFGFVGMLVGVPLAAAIGVLARFGISRYQTSPLFLGPGQDASLDDSNLENSTDAA